MKIDKITARATPDTRGRPTVETTLTCGELSATASVPSGESTGTHEAVELRDADGSVTRAIENVNSEIADAVIGRDFSSLDELDTFLIKLDGTPNKSRLGANAILSVSIAAMRLSALQEGTFLWKTIAKRMIGRRGFFESVPSAATSAHAEWRVRNERNALEKSSPTASYSSPHLFVNVINGGVHANFRLPFQEYMLVVEGETSVALPIAQKAFAKLGQMLGSDVPMGDEGGYAPKFDTLEKPFEILAELVKEFQDTSIAVDVAASQLFHDGSYKMLGTSYSADELSALYREFVERFPLTSIEDPYDENMPGDFTRITAEVGNKILIVGDDLTCTNPILINDAIQNKAVNAVLIKPNQIGTVMEAIKAVQETQSAGFKVIASHRSGETNDTFIADFAYGVGAYGIKAGGLGQRERLEKYDRLLAIEHEAKTV